ncbi:MAG: DUF4192 domain-containing protein [Nocardioidaceae bacterium]|nr:DUF4192 domain-containing protein [Nocardioidaceae bacterium]
MNDDDATTVLRINDPGEIVSGLPALFGFTPRESLVVLALTGERGRIESGMRNDLVPAEVTSEQGEHIVRMLLRNGVSTVIVVGCSDDAALCATNVYALCGALERAGIALREALRCDGERWWSYSCHERCCPPAGTAYDPLASRLLAEAVVRGVAMVPDRADLALRFAPVSGSQAVAMEAATDQAVDGIASQLEATMSGGGGGVSRSLVEHGATVVRQALDRALSGVPVSNEDAAILSTWCALVPVRDLAWAQVTRANAAAHLEVWSQIARKVVPPWEPAVLSLTGFCAWLNGDGALAWCALDRVEQADPAYSMAELVRETLRHGLAPDCWIPVPEHLIWDAIDG